MWWMLAAPAMAAFPAHDAAFKAGASAPDDAAVIIGIENYFVLPDVPYAERDAQAVRDLMIYTIGIPSDRVAVVSAPANKERIHSALQQARDLVGPTGTLWVYFAGHGAASPSTGERVLLGADAVADAESFDVRSVSIPSIQDAVAGAGARTVMMVDACYSGASRDGGDLLPGKRFAVPSYATPTESRWVEWHAAKPDQLSGPLDIARHGAFTWAMVGALRGWADGQLDDTPDGVVTIEEAELYVEELLRAVDVNDQQPALEASDAAAVLREGAKLEPRPDATQLREWVDAYVPGTPAGEHGTQNTPALPPVAGPPKPPTWRRGCTPSGEYKWWTWASYPGPGPYTAWHCEGGSNDLKVIQVPPVAGRTALERMVSELVPYEDATREAAQAHRRAVRLNDYGKRKKDLEGVDLRDASTWPTMQLMGPSGPIDARWIGVIYSEGSRGGQWDWLVVEDLRAPGSLLVCGYDNLHWASLTVNCPEVLQSMLAEERW